MNRPLARIHPACSPPGNQSDRVAILVSARIQPIRNNVVNEKAKNNGYIGGASCEKEAAIEWKPEVQVTTADVSSGAFRK